MGARAIRRGVVASRRARSKLIVMAQAIKEPSWFVASPNHMSAYPWDGFVFAPAPAYDVHTNNVNVTVSDVTTALGTFHSQTFPSAVTPAMVDNYALIRLTQPIAEIPHWGSDADWAVASANYGNFAEGLAGANCRGIFFDNEFYGSGGYWPWDWAGNATLGDAGDTYDSGSRDPATVAGQGIDPTRNLADSRAKVYQRGQEAMAAIIDGWPDARIVHLHSPTTSSVLSGLTMAGACGDSVWPWHNQVSYFTELKAAFFGGMAATAHGTRARVLDGGEKYEMQYLSHVLRYAYWRGQGIRTSGTSAYSGANVLSTYYDTVTLAQGLADLDHCNGGVRYSAAQMRSQIIWSMRTQPLVWEYIEEWDVHSDGGDPDPPPDTPYMTAMAEGRAIGTGQGGPYYFNTFTTTTDVDSHLGAGVSAVSGRLRAAAINTDTMAGFTGAAPLANQYSEVVVATCATVGDYVGAYVRWSPGAGAAYVASIQGDDTITLYYFDGAAFTVLGTDSGSRTLPGTLRVEAVGTTIRVLWNGTQEISVTNATLASGVAGAYLYVATLTAGEVDDWSSGPAA